MFKFLSKKPQTLEQVKKKAAKKSAAQIAETQLQILLGNGNWAIALDDNELGTYRSVNILDSGIIEISESYDVTQV